VLQFAMWKGQVWTQTGETSLTGIGRIARLSVQTDDSPRAPLLERITARGHVTSPGQLPRLFVTTKAMIASVSYFFV